MKAIKFFCLVVSLIFSIIPNSHAQTIRFITEASYPPFESTNATGQLVGFDMDIANALCNDMKATCSFVGVPFNVIFSDIQTNKYDAAIAALGVTTERQRDVKFTAVYYRPSARIIASIDKHYAPSSVLGKTIGVQSGSTFQTFLRDKYQGKVNIKTYASIQDAFDDLVAGRVDMVMGDTPTVLTWLKQDGNNTKFATVVGPIIDANYFGQGYGIAINKDNKALLNALNTSLTNIKRNGVYDKIMAIYFGN